MRSYRGYFKPLTWWYFKSRLHCTSMKSSRLIFLFTFNCTFSSLRSCCHCSVKLGYFLFYHLQFLLSKRFCPGREFQLLIYEYPGLPKYESSLSNKFYILRGFLKLGVEVVYSLYVNENPILD